MSDQDNSFIREFQIESQQIMVRLQEILEACEGDFQQVKRLEDYGQSVDRIMGAAKSLISVAGPFASVVEELGDYAAVCKAVGYKASQIRDNEQFYDVCVACLQDATDVLKDIVDHMFQEEKKNIKSYLSNALIDRLKWVSSQFGAEYKATLDVHGGKATKMNQGEIDELLKKLGLD